MTVHEVQNTADRHRTKNASARGKRATNRRGGALAEHGLIYLESRFPGSLLTPLERDQRNAAHGEEHNTTARDDIARTHPSLAGILPCSHGKNPKPGAMTEIGPLRIAASSFFPACHAGTRTVSQKRPAPEDPTAPPAMAPTAAQTRKPA